MARSRTLVNPENPNGIQVPFTAEEEALADKEEAQAVINKEEWEKLAWKRSRQAEYPDWGTQLNKIYDDGRTKWKSEMVEPIKAKWPKDNSGPV